MTDEDRADDVVEDLEAPAAAQADVVGGDACDPSTVAFCKPPAHTTYKCDNDSLKTTTK